MRESVRKQNGTGFSLIVHVSSPGTDEAIIERFRADRSQEYDEFAERCTALLDEIRKEARAADLLARCRGAVEGFSQAVYEAEGMQEPADD